MEVRTVSELRPKIGSYLAGLIEADGSFAIHNKKKNSNVKKKTYRPKLVVVFSLADKPLADKLAIITNAGTLYIKRNAVALFDRLK